MNQHDKPNNQPQEQVQGNQCQDQALDNQNDQTQADEFENRRNEAREKRQKAAKIAFDRRLPTHTPNGEEQPPYIANFTKGLPHDVKTGQIVRPSDYDLWTDGINSGDPADFIKTPLGPNNQKDAVEFPTWQSQIAKSNGVTVRAWESQGAGLTFDLEGPDAWAVTMPPAPKLDSAELVTEMVEVYSMALLRDVPFAAFSSLSNGDSGVSQTNKDNVLTAIERLNATPWIQAPQVKDNDPASKRKRQPFNIQTVFRGITPGDDVGPYLSQFLLVGNGGVNGKDTFSEFKDGLITYGSLVVNQRVRFADPFKDYMTTWEAWLDAQDGADLRGLETYQGKKGDFSTGYRFIATPRDLATYVHYDALYEAYLNACLIMLGAGVPFDPGIPDQPMFGGVPFQKPDFLDKQQGFAQFGGPHILTLVTEVATRALKAVRYQKFNIHRRLRPEGVGGWVTRWKNSSRTDIGAVGSLVDGLGDDLLKEVADHNATQNGNDDRKSDSNNGWDDSFLLPMAFPEGSPMHPAYGAGHATVAGACVTILKAFFDHTAELPFCYYPKPDGTELVEVTSGRPKLTVEGELNKICSNISIGRNWAGVHYFTDYIESIRMGEKIAIGILEEQAITYNELENFSMTVPLFDGGSVTINKDGIHPDNIVFPSNQK